MKKKLFVVPAILFINVIAILMSYAPKANAIESGNWFYSTMYCACNAEEELTGHWTCEYAACCSRGNLWLCYEGWPLIPCGEPFSPPPAL
jgi:hypothetical protein